MYFLLSSLVIYILYIVLIHGDGECYESKLFYESRLNLKILAIDSHDYYNKGIGIYYYLDKEKDTFLFKNTNYLHTNYPDMQIGDSIVKNAKTEDFKIYRKGEIIEYNNIDCQCKYCE
jgi:hypothetical protein